MLQIYFNNAQDMVHQSNQNNKPLEKEDKVNMTLIIG